MDNSAGSYLVPTGAGVDFAIASLDTDPRRHILFGLLRGAASRPLSLPLLAELAGLTERKAVGALLYRMQRDALVHGDVEPMSASTAPFSEALASLLTVLADGGAAVLADADGLCYAHTGLARADADDLGALAAGVHSLRRRCGVGQAETRPAAPLWGLLDRTGQVGFTLRSVCIGKRLFHLAVSGAPDPRSDAFVRLVALLSRRYLGEC